MIKIIKKIGLFVITLLILIVIIIVFIRMNEKNYLEKFEQTKINTSVEEIKNIWGEPDYFYPDNQRPNLIVMKYKKGVLGWNTYIFLIDEASMELNSKFIDD